MSLIQKYQLFWYSCVSCSRSWRVIISLVGERSTYRRTERVYPCVIYISGDRNISSAIETFQVFSLAERVILPAFLQSNCTVRDMNVSDNVSKRPEAARSRMLNMGKPGCTGYRQRYISRCVKLFIAQNVPDFNGGLTSSPRIRRDIRSRNLESTLRPVSIVRRYLINV